MNSRTAKLFRRAKIGVVKSNPIDAASVEVERINEFHARWSQPGLSAREKAAIRRRLETLAGPRSGR